MAAHTPVLDERARKRNAPRHHRRDETAHVRKNERGGVYVHDDEIQMAFEFLDPEHSGRITIADLKKRLGCFYKNMPAKDLRFLMKGKKELTVEDLRELLIDNEVTNFDPVAEAFKVYDPESQGFAQPRILRQVFEDLGFGELSEEDMQILIETGDIDGDGHVSLSDFRNMVDYNREKEAAMSNAGLGRPGTASTAATSSSAVATEGAAATEAEGESEGKGDGEGATGDGGSSDSGGASEAKPETEA